MRTKAANHIDSIFRACSDRTRLRILHLLSGGELCVCQMVEVLEVPPAKASRHLAALRKAGLVVARKDAQWAYYRLAPAKGDFHRKLLQCLVSGFQEVPELARDAEKLKWCHCP